jgi:hypothetical protein
MKTSPYLTESAFTKDLPEPEISSESLWSEFEQTGSISVFLAYTQNACGLEVSLKDYRVRLPR